MKKLSKFLVASLLGLSLAACGSSAPAEEPAAEGGAEATAETTTETTETTETAASDLKIAYIVSHLGDKSFADSGERGMEQLRKEGYDAKTFEIGDDASKYEDQILDTIDQGYNLIYASSTYFDQCDALAEEYPEVKFVSDIATAFSSSSIRKSSSSSSTTTRLRKISATMKRLSSMLRTKVPTSLV